MKKFFEKKKLDYKFKKAGPGHSLAEEKPKELPQAAKTVERVNPSDSSAAAGTAALARLQSRDSPKATPKPAMPMPSSGSTAASPKVKVQQQAPPTSTGAAVPVVVAGGTGTEEAELRKEGKTLEQSQPPPQVVVVDTVSRGIAVHLVCPHCRHSIPHASIRDHIAMCLQEEYLKDPLSASAKMVHYLCTNKEKRKLCVETLCKYLDNILDHLGEDKYCRIREGNKVFQERVREVEGGELFLEAVGFQQQMLTHQEKEEQFLVLDEEKAKDAAHLSSCKQLLVTSEASKPKVDRNLQVFQPSSKINQFDLPDSFYHLTAEEIKKEQKQRTETIERESVLRTRAMKEKEDMRLAARYYQFVLLRVRMPDGIILQAVFRPLERLSELRKVLSECLSDQTLTFNLSFLGNALEDDSATLAQLGLVPSAVLNLSLTSVPPASPPFISQELLARIQAFV